MSARLALAVLATALSLHMIDKISRGLAACETREITCPMEPRP